MSDTQRAHYEGCWRRHHECAIAVVERLQRELATNAAATGASVKRIEGQEADLAAARRDLEHASSERHEQQYQADRAREQLAQARADAELFVLRVCYAQIRKRNLCGPLTCALNPSPYECKCTEEARRLDTAIDAARRAEGTKP